MIRQFDVVSNPDSEESAQRPYLVVLQSDLVHDLRSAIVAPLVVHNAIEGARRLNPIIAVEGHEFWLATHELFAVDRRILRNKVATAAEHRDAIIAALDFVFTGF
jgi:toxin CcdB